ncbi:MAG: RIP metalloprotease RseP [Bacteroidaceae bacterium]|nr:RIP metalloprotease RseP [Bacteroidaceae bacterium]
MDVQVVLIKALQLLCCLSLLVLLHEGGHFGFSKLFGVKVEKFYMFFDYKFHLFSTRSKWFTRLFPHFKNNETEYGIGWIPLGGYVKISGMIDESMDLEQMKKPAQANEFRAQKVWKRFFIMFGGVLMNFLTAWFIYSAVMFTWGRDYLPMREITQGFQFNKEAQSLGFRDGDIPVAIDGKEIVEYTPSLFRTLSNASNVTVLRGNEEVTLQMPEDGLNMLEMLQSVPRFMSLYTPAIVDSVAPGSAAQKAGFQKGTRLLAVNGKEISTKVDFDCEVTLRRQDVLAAAGCTHADSLKQRQLQVVYQLTEDAQPDTIMLHLDKEYKMGVTFMLPDYKQKHVSYTLLSCIPAGLQQGWGKLTGYVNDMKYVASAEGAKSVGSFIAIGNVFPSTWDWQQFWLLTAFISIILAVMNILPIPGLDGGHIVFLLWEGITGKQPSDKAAEWFEKIGLGLLILLMLLAFSNDIRNFILPLFGF